MKSNKIIATLTLFLFSALASSAQQPVDTAPTLGPVMRAYYAAINKKDDLGVRRVLSKDCLGFLVKDMKEDHKTNLAAYLAEVEARGNKVEVRNEKFKGNKGKAEVRGRTYISWTPIYFIKEKNGWKLSCDVLDID